MNDDQYSQVLVHRGIDKKFKWTFEHGQLSKQAINTEKVKNDRSSIHSSNHPIIQSSNPLFNHNQKKIDTIFWLMIASKLKMLNFSNPWWS